MLIRRGMGDMNLSAPQLIGTTGAVAGSTLPLLLPLFGVAGPVGLAVGAAVAGVTALLSAFGVGGGCGQSCVVASKNADQVEAAMKANLAAFQAGRISREEAITNFQSLWTALDQACGQIAGDAGRNCIADRQEGACKWRDSSGECWNWFKGYRDPILTAAAPATLPSAVSVVNNLSWDKQLLLGLGAALVLSEALS